MQVAEEAREYIPDNYYYMVATLQELVGDWPEEFLYDACPTCNKLFRGDLRGDDECPVCSLDPKYEDKPARYSR
jgi:hypothetical protein